MKRKKINVVWLKRDLRTQDHEALYRAEDAGLPYLIIYVFEPSIIKYKDTSLRHLQFIYHSISEMNEVLKPSLHQVHTFYSEMEEVFEYLSRSFKIEKVFSYQESGVRKTWDRDRRIKKYFKVQNIRWEESQRFNVRRGIQNRTGWNNAYEQRIHSQLIQNEFSSKLGIVLNEAPFQLPKALESSLRNYPKEYQPAGEKYAWRYLNSFAEARGFQYHRLISKPKESRQSCSRISPYLAWGNLSVKQAYQFIFHHQNAEKYKRAFEGMLTRLVWHCHFIQKFEVECEYETRCINRGYELLSHNKNQVLIKAWEEGVTGYPLIDACMRCLQKTGWINFRMRAMLVSFFCFQLDQDWRDGVYHLAKLFLDYEPGIHYPQFQMQAGTTGVNTIRMHNPIKQSQDHDPKGVFIKEWVPELVNVPSPFIHEPWKMTAMEQELYNFDLEKDYHLPIVDLESTTKIAKDKIWGHRSNPMVQKEKWRILKKHTNRSKHGRDS